MIYVFLAKGFEEVEALAPVDCLRRAGKQVQTVGIGGKVVEGAHGISVTADITEDAVVLDNSLEMVVLPGGMPGTLNLGQSDTVKKALQFAKEQDKWITAICAAPSVLGREGLLKDKKAVVYPGFEKELHCAKVGHDTLCVDGKIITAKGPGVAFDFALKLVEVLLGKEVRRSLAEKMIYKK